MITWDTNKVNLIPDLACQGIFRYILGLDGLCECRETPSSAKTCRLGTDMGSGHQILSFTQ